MLSVWKFSLMPLDDVVTVRMPVGARPLGE